MKSLSLLLGATMIASPSLAQNDTDWRTPWSTTEIEAHLREDGAPVFSIVTVQPLYESAGNKNTIFTQIRAAYGDNARTTLNAGIGYRRLLLNDTVLAGINIFYDRQWPTDHERIGYGVELRSSAFELNANYYNAISNWKAVSSTEQEQAQSGYNVEIGSQVPFVPWAHAFVSRAHWDGIEQEDIDTTSYSIRLRPINVIEIEAGVDDHDNGPSNSFVQARYRFAFGGKMATPKQWIDNKAFVLGDSMADKTLERVRRIDDIQVETRANPDLGARVSITVGRED